VTTGPAFDNRDGSERALSSGATLPRVIFCEHVAPDGVAMAEVVTGPVSVQHDLCVDPDPIGRLLAGNKGVVVGCDQGPSRRRVQHVLASANVDLLDVQQVQIDRQLPRSTMRTMIKSLRSRLCGDHSEVPVRYISERTQGLSRRQLLGLERSEQVAIPGVQTDLCRASSGCRVCLEACPLDALSMEGGLPEIDPSVCSPCGLCVAACPTGAMVDPSATAVEVHAQVSTAVSVAKANGDTVGIVFNCRHQSGSMLDRWIPVDVTATGTVRVGWMLAPLLMGAAGVSIPHCEVCDSDPDATARVEFCRQLLESCGHPNDVVRRDTGQLPQALPVHVRLKEPFAAAGVVETLTALLESADDSAVVEHPASPVGIVEFGEACVGSLACITTCPTQALALRGEDHAVVIEWTGALCAGCGQCLVVCPEIERGSITLLPRVDPIALSGEPRMMKRHRSVRCRICGGDIVASELFDRVGVLMDDPEVFSEDFRVCPRCMESALLGVSRELFNRR